jgi:hypothetical protein
MRPIKKEEDKPKLELDWCMKAFLVCFAFLFLVSCGPQTKEEKSYKVIPNDPGQTLSTSTIKGSITWRKSGAGGITVLLCGTIFEDLINGFSCAKQYAKTVTDGDGNYVFKDLKPNDYKADSKEFVSYTPVAQIDGSPSTYFYWKSSGGLGLRSSDSIHPDPEKTYQVNPIEIYKNDVKLVSPAQNEKIRDHRPAFMWEEYPEADRYSVSLYSVNTKSLYFQTEKEFKLDSSVSGTRPVEDLPIGEYVWTVKVYGKSAIGQIAKSNQMTGVFEVVSEVPPGKKKGK